MNTSWFIGLVCALMTVSSQAQFDEVEISATQLSESMVMLEGRGGNLAVLSGPDGVILIDDQYAPLTDKILTAIREFTDQPVRFVVNTHWHIDHTEGNEQLGEMGAVIVAHDNVRERMSTEQFMQSIERTFPPSPAAALPLVTFNDRAGFHINGETVTAYHVPNAHTDGDVIVHFPKNDVIHMGDNFFTGMYPLVDRSSGGSVQGMIAAVQFGLGLCDTRTRVIPGHGKLANCAELEDFGEMLSEASRRIQQMMDRGQTLQEIIEARPNADFDEKLGQGWIKPDRFIEFIFNSLRDGP